MMILMINLPIFIFLHMKNIFWTKIPKNGHCATAEGRSLSWPNIRLRSKVKIAPTVQHCSYVGNNGTPRDDTPGVKTEMAICSLLTFFFAVQNVKSLPSMK